MYKKWTLLLIFLLLSRLLYSEKGYMQKMVLVEEGCFKMGSYSGDRIEKPPHSVTVNDFYLSMYEVNQQEYEELMDTNIVYDYGVGDDYPVYYVSWYDAVEFCNRLSEKEGLAKCYSGSGKNIKCDFEANGYRLPTEAEWEFAAKGGNKSKGYKYPGSNKIDEVAYFWRNSGDKYLNGNWKHSKISENNCKTHPAGDLKPNEIGIYDMGGNVWEWCWDWFGNYDKNPQFNPTGPQSGSERITRGGSWLNSDMILSTTIRYHSFPDINDLSTGFRVARSLPR